MAAETIGILGIVGVVDVCLTWGKKLVETCQAFGHADTRLHESICRLEARWWRIEVQLQMLRKMDPLLRDDHRNVQQRTLEIVMDKLKAAVSRLEDLVDKPDAPDAKPEVKKLKYALFKSKVAEAISELEQWQQIFDPSWFLMLKIADTQVDSLLAAAAASAEKAPSSSTSLPAAQSMRRVIHHSPVNIASPNAMTFKGLEPGSICPIPFSTTSTALRAGTQQLVLLDPVACASGTSADAMARGIQGFAFSLRRADPLTSGLLSCKGILNADQNDASAAAETTSLSNSTGLAFIFRLPDTHPNPESLRSRLLGGPDRAHDSLSERLALARRMAAAVSYVHLYGFVHKNIRPETILLLHRSPPGQGGGGLAGETAALVGFDVLRDAEGSTSRVGDDDWEKNLYRHPQRQGVALQFDYEMRHDIYSLGVCLLEVGLWASFVDYYGTGDGRPGLGPGLGVSGDYLTGTELLKDPEKVRERLLSLARSPPLRRQMGTLYAKVVETCLTCLERDNVDFGDEKEFHGGDGVAVGVRYIKKVVVRLGEINV